MNKTTETDPAATLVDASGRPARTVRTQRCPRCGAGPDRRVASGGFGVPHPVCAACGHEWHGDVFQEEAR